MMEWHPAQARVVQPKVSSGDLPSPTHYRGDARAGRQWILFCLEVNVQNMQKIQDAGLTRGDCGLILESLRDTKRAIEEYADYPSYEFKQERLAEVRRTMERVKEIKEAL